MARADVKLTMNTEQFRLMMECLEECGELEQEQAKQDGLDTEDGREHGQRAMAIAGLIRQLKD